MGDDEAGSSFHEFVKGFLDEEFGAGVDGAGGLIEDEHRRKAEHDAGDAQELFLSLGEGVVGEDGVESVWHAADEFPAMGFLRGLDDFLIGGVRLADVDVVPDSAVFQPCLLEDHAVVAAEGMAGHVADVGAVHADGALIDIIEAHQEVDKGGLAAAGRTDDGDLLTGLCVQMEVFDKFPVFDIAEGDVVDRHVTLCCWQLLLRIGALRFFLNESKDTRRAGEGILQLGDDGADVIERFGVLVRVGKQHGEAADGQVSPEYEHRAGEGHRGIDHGVDKPGAWVGQAGVKGRLLAVILQSAVDLPEAVRGRLFVSECLDDLLSADHLLNQRGLLAAGLRLLAEHRIGMRRDEFCHKEAHRSEDDHHQSDGHALLEHEEERDDDGDDAGEELREAEQQTVRELVHIGDDAAHDVPGAVCVEIGQRQYLNLADGPAADVLHHPEGHPVVDEVHQECRRAGDKDQHQDPPEHTVHRGKIHLSPADDAVYGIAEENRDIQLQNHRDRRQHDAEEQQETIGSDERHHLAEGSHGTDIVALHADVVRRRAALSLLLYRFAGCGLSCDAGFLLLFIQNRHASSPSLSFPLSWIPGVFPALSAEKSFASTGIPLPRESEGRSSGYWE